MSVGSGQIPRFSAQTLRHRCKQEIRRVNSGDRQIKGFSWASLFERQGATLANGTAKFWVSYWYRSKIVTDLYLGDNEQLEIELKKINNWRMYDPW